ncbi:hypothetical protein BC936DRAFT_147719 [Jimgerdemannia flammicorona]|uniref:Uncharacterized protein n=1 Tax=Jimgerdemannia flammicorona TaxID=994334 RepID=A0A433D4N7_9FUNG|nr:hypothetical protein BC936DRAFT_147719 [Jimgerdemannia flammicorona]
MSEAIAAAMVFLFVSEFSKSSHTIITSSLNPPVVPCPRDIVPQLHKHANLVVTVCGGSNISIDVVASYRKRYASPPVIVYNEISSSWVTVC